MIVYEKDYLFISCPICHKGFSNIKNLPAKRSCSRCNSYWLLEVDGSTKLSNATLSPYKNYDIFKKGVKI